MFREGVIMTIVAALLLVSSAAAQQQSPTQPAPQRQRPNLQQRCEAVLPRQAVEQIAANYRDRLRTARENVAREQRALRDLLVADNSTKAAVDAQQARAEAARTAMSRVQVDLLWDLRSVVPAQDRQLAFRCAQVMLRRATR